MRICLLPPLLRDLVAAAVAGAVVALTARATDVATLKDSVDAPSSRAVALSANCV
jgi:hypothetical protein